MISTVHNAHTIPDKAPRFRVFLICLISVHHMVSKKANLKSLALVLIKPKIITHAPPPKKYYLRDKMEPQLTNGPNGLCWSIALMEPLVFDGPKVLRGRSKQRGHLYYLSKQTRWTENRTDVEKSTRTTKVIWTHTGAFCFVCGEKVSLLGSRKVAQWLTLLPRGSCREPAPALPQTSSLSGQ